MSNLTRDEAGNEFQGSSNVYYPEIPTAEFYDVSSDKINRTDTLSLTLSYSRIPDRALLPSDFTILGNNSGCELSVLPTGGTGKIFGITVTNCDASYGNISIKVMGGVTGNSSGFDTGATSSSVVVDNPPDDTNNVETDGKSLVYLVRIPEGGFEYKLGIQDGFNYDFQIDWGDGSSVENHVYRGAVSPVTHTYATPGYYIVKITGTAQRINFSCSNNQLENDLITKVYDLGDLRWTNLSYMFSGS